MTLFSPLKVDSNFEEQLHSREATEVTKAVSFEQMAGKDGHVPTHVKCTMFGL